MTLPSPFVGRRVRILEVTPSFVFDLIRNIETKHLSASPLDARSLAGAKLVAWLEWRTDNAVLLVLENEAWPVVTESPGTCVYRVVGPTGPEFPHRWGENVPHFDDCQPATIACNANPPAPRNTPDSRCE
jgi:hypothetical protein